MIYLALVILGLIFGSFVNALVWRIYKQYETARQSRSGKGEMPEELSIVRGRSMCSRCHHELAPQDLVPVLSWFFLGGKCRYCHQPIEDTPLPELLLPLLFVLSYLAWPYLAHGWSPLTIALFAVWLLVLICFMALALYDAKWFILPDRIVAPLTVLALLVALLRALLEGDVTSVAWSVAGAATISGVFWLLSAASRGTWIGWGDVKLGLSLGLVVGTPLLGVLVIFIASVFGALLTLPQLLTGKRGLQSSLPFGPHLIAATVVVFLWGEALYSWYFGLLAG